MHVNIVVSNDGNTIRTVDQKFNDKDYVVERATNKSEIISILRPNLLMSTWIKDSIGWWYKLSDGSYPISEWKYIDNKWYYFDENGYMATGWIEIENKLFYLKGNGEKATNETINIEGYLYNFDTNGEILSKEKLN